MIVKLNNHYVQFHKQHDAFVHTNSVFMIAKIKYINVVGWDTIFMEGGMILRAAKVVKKLIY